MAAPKKTKIDMVKAQDEPKTTTVELIGTFQELLGEHTLFFKALYIEFINGIATVSSDLAEELRTAGQVK